MSLPCSTFALALAVPEVCAGGGDGVGQCHERHLLHAGQAWKTGVEKVAGQNLGVLWSKVCGTVL